MRDKKDYYQYSEHSEVEKLGPPPTPPTPTQIKQVTAQIDYYARTPAEQDLFHSMILPPETPREPQ